MPLMVMTVDPGQITGVAYLVRDGSFWTDEGDFDTAADWIEGACAGVRGGLWLQWEAYRMRPDKPQTHAWHALTMIGVAKRYGRKHGCRIIPEAEPRTPKPPDQRKLKALGWWLPGKKDSQSAASHLLRLLERERCLPPREREILSAVAGTV